MKLLQVALIGENIENIASITAGISLFYITKKGDMGSIMVKCEKRCEKLDFPEDSKAKM